MYCVSMAERVNFPSHAATRSHSDSRHVPLLSSFSSGVVLRRPARPPSAFQFRRNDSDRSLNPDTLVIVPFFRVHVTYHI